MYECMDISRIPHLKGKDMYMLPPIDPIPYHALHPYPSALFPVPVVLLSLVKWRQANVSMCHRAYPQEDGVEKTNLDP